MSHETVYEEYFKLFEQEGLCSNKNSLLFYIKNYLFKNIELERKSLIDIGSGGGIYSLFAGLAAARRIVCLEPALEGSKKANIDKFERLLTRFAFPQIELKKFTFQNFDSESETFDIILFQNSINHLDEEACKDLNTSKEAREKYEPIFKKIVEISKTGTKLIIADCSRNNFFGFLKIKNPFAPTIQWHKHQSPYLWIRLLQEFGFTNAQIKWTTFGRLRSMGRILLSNPIASYFLKSHFVLTLTKG